MQDQIQARLHSIEAAVALFSTEKFHMINRVLIHIDLAVGTDSLTTEPNQKITAPIRRFHVARQHDPEPRGPVNRTGEHPAAVGAEGHTQNRTGVA